MGGRVAGQSSCHGGPAARVQPASSQPNPKEKQSNNVRVPTQLSATWLDISLSSENVKGMRHNILKLEKICGTLDAKLDGRMDRVGGAASRARRSTMVA